MDIFIAPPGRECLLVRSIEHDRDPEKVRTEAEITEPSDFDQDPADTPWDAKDVECMRDMQHIPIFILYTYEHIKLCICKSPPNVREQTCSSCTIAPPSCIHYH